MKLLKHYEMNYGDLAKLCKLIEQHLDIQTLGTSLHDIASPLASLARDFCVECANEYYKDTINNINATRDSLYKEVMADLIAKIKD